MSEPRRQKTLSVFLESRYRKLVRDLPQTVLYCPACKGNRRRRRGCPQCEGRGRLADDSVQQIIGRTLAPLFGAHACRFHGAGREDVDVRMLGRGRPFVFEVVAPARPDQDLGDLHAQVALRAAGRIELDPFQPSSRERVRFWKTATFDKTYLVRARLGGVPAVEPHALVGQEVDVDQRTPARVAHRRADLTRPRQVAILAVAALATGEFDLTVRCTHGTYVKEWVSGDEGRTVPSLAALLDSPAVCTQLDVLDIGDAPEKSAEPVRDAVSR